MSTSTTVPAASGREAGLPWLRRYPENVSWDQSFEPVPLPTLLARTALRFPHGICTNFYGRTTSYSDIERDAERAAAGLQRLGIGKGDRVGLLLPNSTTYIVYYYATLKLGAVVVNFNPLYTVEELTGQAKDSGTDIMVTLDLKLLFEKVESLLEAGTLQRAIVASFPSLLPAAKGVLYRLLKGKDLAKPSGSKVAGKIIADADVRAGGSDYRKPLIDPVEDLAVLQYTGGTTGTPKGAMLTHANLSVNVLQSLAWVPQLEPGKERVLAALPYFHVFAMTGVMNFAIAAGFEMVVMPRFVLDEAMKLVTKTKVTVMPGVPTMFIAMLNHPKLKTFDLSSLKFCLSGGAPLLLETKQSFEALTGCKVVEAYGLSEASPAVTINPLEGPVKVLSIGQPIPGTIVSLRNPALNPA